MRNLLLMLGILGYQILVAQYFHVPPSVSIQNDGLIDSLEWSNSDTTFIRINPSLGVTVLYQHDGAQLNLAYFGNLQSPSNYFPELMVDVNHDQASTIQADDWWFHVSATDCDYQGSYGNYSLCQAIRPNWLANPNFSLTGPATDTVEISIPFQTLGLAVGDTIGLCFLLNNFQSFRYASTSADHLNPSTWDSFVISGSSSILKEKDLDQMVKLWPNPIVGEKLNIELRRGYEFQSLLLRELSGRVLKRLTDLNKTQYQIDLIGLSKGIYFLEINSPNGKVIKKVIRR